MLNRYTFFWLLRSQNADDWRGLAMTHCQHRRLSSEGTCKQSTLFSDLREFVQRNQLESATVLQATMSKALWMRAG